MSRLATAIIIAFLLSASTVTAEEQPGHWRGGDIIFDGTNYYRVYGYGITYHEGVIHGLQKCSKEGVLMEPDVAIRKDVSPGTAGIEFVSGPSAPAPKEQAEETALSPETSFETKKFPPELKEQASAATAQAEARAKEPEGPQLTTYPGVAGQFYEAAIIHDDRLEIYNTYAVLDEEGNPHFLEQQADGKYKEVTLSIKESDREYFEKEFTSKITEAQSQTPWFARTLSSAVWLYRQYSGMAGWSSLIFDEEFLQKWRDGINKAMCGWTGGLLGKQCLTSKICGRYYDIENPRDGILYSSPVGGVPEAVAHIEGQRSLPFITPSETMWVYTVTFGLSNPSDDEGMTYNVAFNGPARSALWWAEPQYLPEKGSVSAIGAAALMKLSPNDYSEVCIQFDPSIDTFDGKRKDHICNGIVQYTGGATAPYGMTANTTLALPGSQPETAPGANI